MAYTFLLESDNCLTASRREVIMQKSKLVDEIVFLVNPQYKKEDMSIFNVMMEYILPVSKEYHTLELIQDSNGYQDYLKFVVPFDCNLSSEAGDIQLQLTFTFVGLDADGDVIQKVRKTKVGTLHVTPISNWSDFIPDSALSSLDQRILKTQAQINELGYYAQVISENQVDNLKYDSANDTLQLTSNGNTVGDAVSVRDMLDDGVPVVDLDSIAGDGGNTGDGCSCDCDCWDNVVEFGYNPIVDEDKCCPCGCQDNVVEFGYNQTTKPDAPTTPEDDESNVIVF